MVLVDTSVWVTHLRNNSLGLRTLLLDNLVLTHPFIIGELACGHMKNRREILSLLSSLPQAKAAEHEEVLQFLDVRQLAGSGLGWVDVHLLASAALSHVSVWTFDKTLAAIAQRLSLRYPSK